MCQHTQTARECKGLDLHGFLQHGGSALIQSAASRRREGRSWGTGDCGQGLEERGSVIPFAHSNYYVKNGVLQQEKREGEKGPLASAVAPRPGLRGLGLLLSPPPPPFPPPPPLPPPLPPRLNDLLFLNRGFCIASCSSCSDTYCPAVSWATSRLQHDNLTLWCNSLITVWDP